ncbi:MAG: nicotinate-nucleotide--dimethylbenzimidazole phosphoribosyltransferase [Rhodobacteraceae bacterium]|nr:nicotinate-nucleotide--dimethylbenzimidazole phosphoribosyltransferase [Paracoccaceae bacterium]
MLFELTDLDALRRSLTQAPDADEAALSAASERNRKLTKPPGALGRLEELAIWYAGWRGVAQPRITAPQVIVFAGNHGVTARGVSAFPPRVTAQMVANFQHGGAAINQLARVAGARMDVHAIDLDHPTADFTELPAMTDAECVRALNTGWTSVEPTADLVVVGEMGIGNTTPAAAIAMALFGGAAADWAGRGTGVDDAGLARKIRVMVEGVARHGGAGDGLDILARLGGREIAAMAGAIAAARMRCIPVILDGFICTAAAATLAKTDDRALAHCLAGHESAEQAHARMLSALNLEPILSLGLRLGEGTGAALAIPVLKSACACLSDMATFAEAGVAGGD